MPPAEASELLRLREPQPRPGHGACAEASRPTRAGESRGVGLDAAGVRLAGFTRRAWLLFSLMGGLIYGYNVSLAASLQYIRDDLALSAGEEEAVSATATLSDAASMLAGGWLADRFGRKATAMFACACSITGALLAGAASGSFAWLVLWRLCSGVGNGLSILLLPMYISECVDARSRGGYLAVFQLGVNVGCALPYLFMIAVTESWRACLAFGSLPALYVLYNFHFYFPESIRWLRWKAGPDGALDLELGDPDAAPLDDDDDDDDMDESDGTGTTKASSQSSAKYGRVAAAEPESTDPTDPTDPTAPLSAPVAASRRPHVELVTGVLLAYVNNCVDASLFYGPEIIASTRAGFSRRDANVFGLLCALVAVAAVLVAARCLIDRFSRRALYLLSLAIVCVCFLLSGALFARYSADDFARDPRASAAVMLVFAALNVAAAVGPSVLFVVILSELFHDNSYRARYMSYCTFAMSLISLLVNGSLLSLFQAAGTAATFTGYGVSYVLCLGYFWAFLPETKQRQLV